jgi:hypothetical protein
MLYASRMGPERPKHADWRAEFQELNKKGSPSPSARAASAPRSEQRCQHERFRPEKARVSVFQGGLLASIGVRRENLRGFRSTSPRGAPRSFSIRGSSSTPKSECESRSTSAGMPLRPREWSGGALKAGRSRATSMPGSCSQTLTLPARSGSPPCETGLRLPSASQCVARAREGETGLRPSRLPNRPIGEPIDSWGLRAGHPRDFRGSDPDAFHYLRSHGSEMCVVCPIPN